MKPEEIRSHYISGVEKETIILFNEAEPIAEYFTYNKALQKHFKQKLGIQPFKDNGYGGEFYHIEKKRIPLPRKPKQLSAEARQKLGERLRKSQSLRPKRHSNLANDIVNSSHEESV